MMEKVFNILSTAFSACTGWFTDLVNATGSRNVILAAFGIALIIGLLFMPLRGGRIIPTSDEVGSFASFTKNKIHKGRVNVAQHSWKRQSNKVDKLERKAKWL